MTMKKLLAATSISALAATTAQAGIVAIPPAVVPVDSPWMLAGIAALLAVIGARILHNRRK